MNPATTGIGTETKAALQALGKRIIENSTLYHFGKSDGQASPGSGTAGGGVQLPPKKQKLDNNVRPGDSTKVKDEAGQRVDGPYLTYEQYENLLLYRESRQSMYYVYPYAHFVPGKQPPPQQSQQLPHQLHPQQKPTHHIPNGIPQDNMHPHMDTLISESFASYEDGHHPGLAMDHPHHPHIPNPNHPHPTLTSPITHHTHTHTHTHTHHIQPQLPLTASLASPTTILQPGTVSPVPSPTSLTLVPIPPQPQSPQNTAHAVALLTSAENQKIQRKKANQQEREILEKYYNDHYIDQAVKIRKEDLTELAFTLNWHVLRVQGWMHTHRQSRTDYNPPKRTKRRATLPQEQDLLKHYFKLWTEQGLIDLHSPTRVTPKDYEVVAAALGWDNERVRRWTDHYKQKIKAATEGNP